ncbi:protein phosphatase 2C domain-containing protein [Chryseobacterium sp. MEBOG07]|uniref:protein phosphatase 2C domain-containing protein n=1 Tax=Chryseobacterium sp. MEBOG07 TaxID=2879939 RepID=UPI001F423941|nr:protein phosphatase 2C domain-containing protein [Chryseobacterium sp. MEBOG07]UKB78668.1 protein phosphatase 2C domain-containing protein [Chryseobacterium sp. MEBOG07]
MNLYSTLQIGDYHINHCEDDLLIKKIGSDKIVCAVMDGCSTAMDSHFASTLIGKILRKVIIEAGYRILYEKDNQHSLEEELKEIIKGLFKELKFVKNHLMLDEKELLTTLIILVYDITADEGLVLTIGDGVVCINGNITEFDRNNKPDYLAYHLHENFEDWYSGLSQKIFFDHLDDVSIATDGISSFSKIKKTDSDEGINFMQYLMIDQQNNDTEEMLNRKLKQLEHQYGVKPTDDLAIIRMIK